MIRYAFMFGKQVRDAHKFILLAIIVRLLRDKGVDYGRMDEAVLGTWQELWNENLVPRQPPWEIEFIDVRCEEAIGFAANVWQRTWEDTWNIMNDLVTAGKMPATMPMTDFKHAVSDVTK